MITSTSTWRCKCGVRVKVVSQTPNAEPTSTQFAARPQCGDKQMIYGKTILSATTEDGRPIQDAEDSN
jgi:hypothetical protein